MDGDAKALFCSAKASTENVADAEPAPNLFGWMFFQVEKEGGVPRDHRQIAEPREAKLAPRTPTHARASVHYAVAAALAEGALGDVGPRSRE